MSKEVSSIDMIELIKEKYEAISDEYEIKVMTDDGGRVIDINTLLYEHAAVLRKILPSKFKGHRVTISYYTT